MFLFQCLLFSQNNGLIRPNLCLLGFATSVCNFSTSLAFWCSTRSLLCFCTLNCVMLLVSVPVASIYKSVFVLCKFFASPVFQVVSLVNVLVSFTF